MKKFYSLMLLLVMVGLNATAYTFAVVGDAFAGWGMPGNVQYFTDNGDGTYTLVYAGATANDFKLTGVSTDNVQFVDWNGTGDTYFNNGLYGSSSLAKGDNELSAGYSSNINLPIAGDVTLTISNVTATSCKLNIAVTNEVAVTETYTVAGTPTDLFGTEWAPTNTDNDMTLADGVYTWQKTGLVLSGGTAVQFKVCKNHAWGTAYPQNDYETQVPEDGTFTVTITMDAATHDVNCVFTKEGDAVITHTYTVGGTPTAVFGTEWDKTNTDNDMSLVDGLYTLTKSNVELGANQDVSFKVIKDHNWDIAYPSANYVMTTTVAGTYNVTITFNAETTEVVGALELVQGEVVEPDYYLKGAFDNWGNGVQLVKQADGTYVSEEAIAIAAGQEFLVYDNNSNNYYGPQTAAYELTEEVPGADLYANTSNNFVITSDQNLTVKVGINDNEQLYIHTEGWVSEVLTVNVIGGVDSEWSEQLTFPLTLDTETNYYVSAADIAISAGFNFKVFVNGDRGTDANYGAVVDGDHWLDLTAEQFGQGFDIATTGQNIYFPEDATVQFVVPADFSYMIINGAFVPGISLNEMKTAGAGEYKLAGPVAIAYAKDGKLYVVDADKVWMPLNVSGVDELSALTDGGLQNIKGSFDGNELDPLFTVTSAEVLASTDIDTTPYQLILGADEIEMPVAGQVVEVFGYWHNGKLRGYSGKNGSQAYGREFNLAGDTDDLVEGECYLIPVAVKLNSAWSSSTITDVNSGDSGIGFGGGGSGGARAPRRIAATDDNATQNLTGTIVGEVKAGVETGVNELNSDKAISGVQYVNVAGQVSAEPFEGVNIVVTTYVDGTRSAVKVVK